MELGEHTLLKVEPQVLRVEPSCGTLWASQLATVEPRCGSLGNIHPQEWNLNFDEWNL